MPQNDIVETYHDTSKTEGIITEIFDPYIYIENLMKEMDFDEKDEAWEPMFNELKKRVDTVIVDTVSLYADPELVDEASGKYDKTENWSNFIRKLIEIDSELQLKLIEELDKLYNEILDVHKRFQ